MVVNPLGLTQTPPRLMCLTFSWERLLKKNSSNPCICTCSLLSANKSVTRKSSATSGAAAADLLAPTNRNTRRDLLPHRWLMLPTWSPRPPLVFSLRLRGV